MQPVAAGRILGKRIQRCADSPFDSGWQVADNVHGGSSNFEPVAAHQRRFLRLRRGVAFPNTSSIENPGLPAAISASL